MFGPLRYEARAQYVKSYRISRGIQNLDTERNYLAKEALADKTVTHIMWVDTDSLMEKPENPNDAIGLLLQCNVPIVSGLYRAKKSKGLYPYCAFMRVPGPQLGYIPIDSWTGNYIKVDVIGFGFILCRREVFEKVPYPWFEWGPEESAPSEDFRFCEKAKQYGFDINLFTEVKLSHGMVGKVKIDGSVHVLDV